MVIRSFRDRETEDFFNTGRISRKKGWSGILKVLRRKLDMLNYASELRDLSRPPANQLETLKRDLSGYYSIRVNDQWRIIFRWDKEPYDVQVIDYH